MTVFVDDVYIPAKVGNMRPAKWCHLSAITKDELHEFALSIGLRRNWFQDHATWGWHYDVTKTVRARAVAAGAVEIGHGLDDYDLWWFNPEREGVSDDVVARRSLRRTATLRDRARSSSDPVAVRRNAARRRDA